MEIRTTAQTILIADIATIVVTDRVADGENYVREFRIFPAGDNVPPALVVRVSADDEAKLLVHTPQLSF